VEREGAKLVENEPAGIRLAARAVFRRAGVREGLRDVRVPVVVIHGGEDRAIPRLAAERMVSAIPGATLKMLPRAGHLSAVEEPERVSELLLELLGRLDSTGRRGYNVRTDQDTRV
jgi:pimeloyl-ACP methyl ester carboxylesterase